MATYLCKPRKDIELIKTLSFMKKRLFSLILIMVAVASVSSAQGRRGLRINEVMVQNESSIVDDY